MTGKQGKLIVLTASQAEWLRENYATVSNKEIGKTLNISETTIRRFAMEMGLSKGANKYAPKPKPKSKKKELVQSKNQGYCIDCKHYREGGLCMRTEKIRPTGALHQKDCFKKNK